MTMKSTANAQIPALWIDDGKTHVHQPKGVERGMIINGISHTHCLITLSRLVSDEFMNELRMVDGKMIFGHVNEKNQFIELVQKTH